MRKCEYACVYPSHHPTGDKEVEGGGSGLFATPSGNRFPFWDWEGKEEEEEEDNKNKKHFHQTWEDNMSIANKPSIKKSTKKGMCKVTSYPDFKRFKIKNLKNHIPLFHKRAYDLALTTKGKVKVKGKVRLS